MRLMWSFPALALLAMVSGCQHHQGAVIAATATTIGVEVGTQSGTGNPTGVLGYRRAEFAHVPTNVSQGGKAEMGVKEVPNVIMELSYGGATSNVGRIYQRLAVGTEAVTHETARVLFAQSVDGNVNPAVLDAAQKTASAADKFVACTVKEGKSVPARVKAVGDRALTDASSKAQVEPHKSFLETKAHDADFLRTYLRANQALAQALAKHQTDADCAL